MQPHQERVIAEKKDLDEKLSKLQAFLQGKTFTTLPSEECDRLQEQWEAMKKYADVLRRRIEAFEQGQGV